MRGLHYIRVTKNTNYESAFCVRVFMYDLHFTGENLEWGGGVRTPNFVTTM